MSAPPATQSARHGIAYPRPNAHGDLANAKRSLRWAEKAVERAKRDTAAAEARLARAQAKVEYLQKIEAASSSEAVASA